MKSFSLFSLGLAVGSASASRLTLSGKRHLPIDSSLGRRASIFGDSSLTDSSDIQYTANLTLGGQEFICLVDTGSADLWVATDSSIPNSKTTGFSASVSYAIGQIAGPIKTAAFTFADYSVASQTYIEVTADASSPAGKGLIGLGPSENSNIRAIDAAATTPLESIFLQNKTTPNYLTILLGRSDEPTNPFPGDLTIGEIVPTFENITSQPQIPVTVNPSSDSGDQHVQVLLDAGGIIGPDGQSIVVTTAVKTTSNNKRLTAVFDSGFSLPQVPAAVAEAFYSPFPGAALTNVTGLGSAWVLPCTAEVNITFKFSGLSYPVHPLDASLDPSTLNMDNLTTTTGEEGCIGSFQPVSFDLAPSYDLILGMAFLRNAYLLFNYGDFVVNSTSKAAPFVQLLSTTEPSDAHTDFVNVRLGGIDSVQHINSVQSSSSEDASDTSSRNNIYYYIGGGILVLLTLLTIGAFFIFRSRSAKKAARYQVLGAPAPAAMAYAGQGQVYNPSAPYAAGGSYADVNGGGQYGKVRYDEPWDHRV